MLLKVRNKKIVSEVARTTYKANRKRNLLTIFAIMLTSFLITIVVAIGASYWNTISLRQIRMQGMDYDIELTEPQEDQVVAIRSMDNVKYAGIAVKCAVLQQYKEYILDKIRLYWLDETCWNSQTIPALEKYTGNYPENENEIMLSQSALKEMGIEKPKMGMSLPMTYFSLKDDGAEEEVIAKDFILCGWFLDYSGSEKGYISKDFYLSTGVQQTDQTQGGLKITLKNPLYSEKDIIEMQNAIGLGAYQIIDADYDTISNFCKIIAGLLVMLCMIFVSGYLFIFNTLYIGVSKDIRYYGQLKTIGMTGIQLRGMVYLQALWNSLIGIPAGILAAVGIVRLLIPKLLHIVNPTIRVDDVVQVSVWIYFVAGFFAFATNMVSSRKPAKIVGECSPIEALRYTASTKKYKNRKRKMGCITSLAWQSMFRDKKQAGVIFLSFVIALSVFLIVNVVIGENDAKRILNGIYTYDIEFKNETTLDENQKAVITADKIEELEEIDGVKYVRKVASTSVVIPYQENVYGEYFKELYQSRYTPGNYEEDMETYKENPADGLFVPRLIAVDEEGFRVLNERLGNTMDKEDFENGEIAVAVKNFTEGDNGLTGKTISFSLPEGLKPEQEYSITIAAVTDRSPAYFAGGYTPDLVVSEKYAKQLLGTLFTELVDVVYEEPFTTELERSVKKVFSGMEKKISCESKLERYAEMKESETQIRILGGSIGLLIALLAVLNYLNVLAAGIQNRAKEFAILESIGMTTAQIRKMLILEGGGYGILSILMALIIGIPSSYLVFNGLNIYRLKYFIPWKSNAVLLSIIMVLCMIAPLLIYKHTQKLSIIEQIRKYEE